MPVVTPATVSVNKPILTHTYIKSLSDAFLTRSRSVVLGCEPSPLVFLCDGSRRFSLGLSTWFHESKPTGDHRDPLLNVRLVIFVWGCNVVVGGCGRRLYDRLKSHARYSYRNVVHRCPRDSSETSSAHSAGVSIATRRSDSNGVLHRLIPASRDCAAFPRYARNKNSVIRIVYNTYYHQQYTTTTDVRT